MPTSRTPAFALFALFAIPAAADDPDRFAVLEARIAELEARLATYEQQVRIAQRKLEIADEAAIASAAPNQPVVAVGEKGFTIETRDKAFQLKLRGLLHADARNFLDDEALPPNADTYTLSRVRPTLEGTIAGIVDFRLMPDFGGGRTVIQDAYIDTRFDPRAKLRVGKFKTPFGIERLQSASDIRFVQRALPNNLVPNRDIGLQLHGELAGGAFQYAVAALNGVADGRSSEDAGDVDNNGDKDVAARVFGYPFYSAESPWLRGLGIGFAATFADQRGDATNTLLPPGYRTPGQQTFFAYRAGATGTFADGDRVRWSPQVSWYAGSFGALGEYVRVQQDVSRRAPLGFRSATLEHDAWQLALNWVVTGEEASYKEIKPKAPFALGRDGWGAFELVARASALDLDDATFTGGAASFADPASAASEARAYAIGLNWYLNRNLKYVLDFERTNFDGGAPGGRDRVSEKAVLGRVQITF